MSKELNVYHHELRHNEYAEFYLKYEVDKVIAEIKAQKAKAEDDCDYWKMSEGNAVNAMHETEEYAMQLYKELRHHKYKRCLAMAKLCRSEWAAAIFIPGKGGTDKQAALYMKWEKRWLALANKCKYKEAK